MEQKTVGRKLDDAGLDLLFREARSTHEFDGRPVDDAVVRELYDLIKLGPTGFNAQPARYLFIRSPEARQRLAPALSSGNRDKTLAAPLNVIVAWDSRFHERLPQQFPAYDAKALFDKAPALIEPAARTNATLQAAYLILAARALGLDAGPMSGFKPELIDDEFFADGRYKALLVMNLGYGVRDRSAGRGPRLTFEEVAEVV